MKSFAIPLWNAFCPYQISDVLAWTFCTKFWLPMPCLPRLLLFFLPQASRRHHTLRCYHTFWVMSGFLAFICTFMNYVWLASKISWWNQRNGIKKDQYGHIRKNLDLNIGSFEFCGEKMGSNQTFLGMERGDCMKGGPKKPVSYQQWQLYVEVDF